MQQEQAQHGDMIFLAKPSESSADYRSIVFKTFALVEWVVANASPQFVLKTDDDSYVHTGNLIAALRRVLPCQIVGPMSVTWSPACATPTLSTLIFCILATSSEKAHGKGLLDNLVQALVNRLYFSLMPMQ